MTLTQWVLYNHACPDGYSWLVAAMQGKDFHVETTYNTAPSGYIVWVAHLLFPPYRGLARWVNFAMTLANKHSGQDFTSLEKVAEYYRPRGICGESRTTETIYGLAGLLLSGNEDFVAELENFYATVELELTPVEVRESFPLSLLLPKLKEEVEF